MALFRIPSKKIQYGYVEVEVDSTTTNAEDLAVEYMEYVSRFQGSEIQYFEDRIPKPEPLPAPAPQATEEDEAVDMIVDGLGATEVPDEPAPWDKPAPTVAEKQPWETNAPVAAFNWS